MRKSIIALSIVALAIGTVYLYVGLRAYLFPQVRGQFMMGGVCAIVGSLMLIAGIILMILAFHHLPKETENKGEREKE